MIAFLKKHWFCVSVIVLFSAFHISIQLIVKFNLIDTNYLLFPQTREEDRVSYWDEIGIIKPGTKIIKYHNLSDRYIKCFKLALDYEGFSKNDKLSKGKYHEYSLTEDDFYYNAKSKPHFTVYIYNKNKVLLERKKVYMMNFDSDEIYGSMREIPAEIKLLNNSFISAVILKGYYKSKENSCYQFARNTTYYIEIVNEGFNQEFVGVKTFWGIISLIPNRKV